MSLRWEVRKKLNETGIWSSLDRARAHLKFWMGRMHEPDFAAFGIMPENSLVLDIGANMGQSAMSLNLANPNLQILSFEPNQSHEKDLRSTQRLLGKNFDFRMFGLGEKNEIKKFVVPLVQGVPLTQEATFDVEFLKDAEVLRRIKSMTGQSHFEIKESEIEIRTLDSLNLAPAALKIDVQGLELSVLRGGWQTIQKFKPMLMLENTIGETEKIGEILFQIGYSPFFFDVAKGKLSAFQSKELTSENVFFLSNTELNSKS